MKGIEFLDKLPVVCPFCKHRLIHWQKETYGALINEKGEPESFRTTYADRLQCSNCLEEFKFTKNGFIITLGEVRQDYSGKLYMINNNIKSNSSNGFGTFNKEEE